MRTTLRKIQYITEFSSSTKWNDTDCTGLERENASVGKWQMAWKKSFYKQQPAGRHSGRQTFTFGLERVIGTELAHSP